MSCFLEYVNSFDSGHKFRTHICTVRSSFFYVGSWKLWDVSCYNVNHIWTQNFLNGKSILAGQKGQSILHFPCSTPFCTELCTQSFQSILERVLARMDEFDKCAVPPGHFCLNISLCVWAVVHKNWAVCGQCAWTSWPHGKKFYVDSAWTITEYGQPKYTLHLTCYNYIFFESTK